MLLPRFSLPPDPQPSRPHGACVSSSTTPHLESGAYPCKWVTGPQTDVVPRMYLAKLDWASQSGSHSGFGNAPKEAPNDYPSFPHRT